ncbi:MAG: succinyl-diaminopimelate desuccinylase [Gammaproteobacteria bacterium]|nr:succinyl-diaminopimelate desuccinylase [Gammaproteobacteria bacterium]
MSQTTSKTIELCQQLVRRPSLTPDDGGCQNIISTRLDDLGFKTEQMKIGEVSNLWATRGDGGPLFCFAGHTDVVPTGDPETWSTDPYSGEIKDGLLFGRGSADMKGALAAMVTATEAFVTENPAHDGTIAFLLTSDEEGPAIDGTAKVMETLVDRGIAIDFCLIGEPSSLEKLADNIRTGRRGSLTGKLIVLGEQGHVAYPELAHNPIHQIAPMLAELSGLNFDDGNKDFPATSLQIVAIDSSSGASNVIPGQLELLFNFRYSPESNRQSLVALCEEILDRHGLNYQLEWEHGGAPFHTRGGKLIDVVCEVIEKETGRVPETSNSGGTSDGRFIAPHGVELVELGLLNSSIHKVDECTPIGDLDQLSRLYRQILQKLLLA